MFHHTIDHSEESTWNGHPQGLSYESDEGGGEGGGGEAAIEGRMEGENEEDVEREEWGVEGVAMEGRHKNVVGGVEREEGRKTEGEGEKRTMTTFEGAGRHGGMEREEGPVEGERKKEVSIEEGHGSEEGEEEREMEEGIAADMEAPWEGGAEESCRGKGTDIGDILRDNSCGEGGDETGTAPSI